MGPGKVVERLRRHYDENVADPEPNPKFDELKKQLLSNPSTFKETVAKGLNEGCYWKLCEVYESDLDDAEVLKLDSDLSLMAIKIPEKVMGKMGFQYANGITFDRKVLEKNSPFRGINVVLINLNAKADTEEHEKSHVSYNERSRPYNDMRSEQIRRRDETTKSLIDKTDETYWEITPIVYEMEMLKELLAGGIAEKNENVISSYGGWFYPTLHATMFVNEIDYNDVFPDCGLVSRHRATDVAKQNSFEYFGRRLNAGINAFKVLRENLPAKEVEKIIETIGTTKEEFESGKYVRPIDELVLWSKHYKEVLKSE